MPKSITHRSISDIFKKHKIKLLRNPYLKKDIHHQTANLLIPFAAKKIFEKMRIPNEHIIIEQLQYLHNDGILGEILNMAMKDEITKLSNKKSFTAHEENILDNLAALETDFKTSKQTEIFLKRFGEELLNIYSRQNK